MLQFADLSLIEKRSTKKLSIEAKAILLRSLKTGGLLYQILQINADQIAKFTIKGNIKKVSTRKKLITFTVSLGYNLVYRKTPFEVSLRYKI